MGLRELKKEQMRQLIADTAQRLFAERGFDRVTVAEIAREAQVAEATVFNYFPSKEDLFYGRLEALGARLTDAVSTRPAGEPALAAFRRALLAEDSGLLAQVAAGDPEALTRLRTVNRVIADSPALLAREQQAFNRIADALAALLADETRTPAETTGTPADLRPQVAANAMLGLHRALVDYVRRRVLGEGDARGLAAEVRKLANAAFALLEHGLGDYAAKPSGPAAGPR